MICPICKKTFNPRTATQTLCSLHCFVNMRRRAGMETEPAAPDVSATALGLVKTRAMAVRRHDAAPDVISRRDGEKGPGKAVA